MDGHEAYLKFIEENDYSSLDTLCVPQLFFDNWKRFNNAYVEELDLIITHDPVNDEYLVWRKDYFSESFIKFVQEYEGRYFWKISKKCYDSLESKVEQWRD